MIVDIDLRVLGFFDQASFIVNGHHGRLQLCLVAPNSYIILIWSHADFSSLSHFDHSGGDQLGPAYLTTDLLGVENRELRIGMLTWRCWSLAPTMHLVMLLTYIES